MALAELMTYVDFSKGIRDIKNYCGLFKGTPKIYSGIARKALERLTIALKPKLTPEQIQRTTRKGKKKKEGVTAKQMLTILKRIQTAYRQETRRERLESIPA
jgi:hypothetical protein